MIDVAGIRQWCLLRPRPASVRCKLKDGEEQDVTMREGASWAQLAETIATLDPDALTAVDANGKVIRATRATTFERKTRDNRPAEVPTALHGDPVTAQITHFANLLHRAYEHTTDVAFENMVKIVEQMNQRNDAIEKRLERTERQYYRTLQDQVDEAFERAEEAGEAAAANAATDPQAAMLQAFMAGMNRGNAGGGAKPANGKG